MLTTSVFLWIVLHWIFMGAHMYINIHTYIYVCLYVYIQMLFSTTKEIIALKLKGFFKEVKTV